MKRVIRIDAKKEMRCMQEQNNSIIYVKNDTENIFRKD